MSLITCKECEKKYSDKSTTCPSCGCPTTYNVPDDTNVKEPIVNKVQYELPAYEKNKSDNPFFDWMKQHPIPTTIFAFLIIATVASFAYSPSSTVIPDNSPSSTVNPDNSSSTTASLGSDEDKIITLNSGYLGCPNENDLDSATDEKMTTYLILNGVYLLAYWMGSQ